MTGNRNLDSSHHHFPLNVIFFQVEWYFKNETLKDTSRIVKLNTENDHSLIIRNVETTDYGPYFCKASNSLGTTEMTVEITAIANPAVFKKESRSTSSTSYNFIWEVDSYSPIIEYQFWFRKYRVRFYKNISKA